MLHHPQDINRVSTAESLFQSGKNCAQAVLGAYADFTGESTETAMKLASGFGGGMGRLQLTCGAATGAIMVIGLYVGSQPYDEQSRKQTANELIQNFYKQFLARNGAPDCQGLLKLDLNSSEDRAEITKRNLSGTICTPCVSSAVEILLELGIGK